MKKKYAILLLIFCFFNTIYAQVGIGTTMPDAQLDVRSSNQITPAATDGILIPKMNVFPAINPTIAQQSMLVYLTTATTFSGNPKPIGFYYWDNSIPDWVGITTTTNGDADWYKVGTTTAPTLITDDMFHTGNAAIGKNTIANSKLDVETNSTDASIQNLQTNANNNTLYGFKNTINGSGSGIHYGIYNLIAGSGTGTQYGNYTSITNTAANTQYGSYTEITGSGFGGHTGNYNLLSGGSGGNQIGTYNEITNTAGSTHIGVLSILSGSGAATKYGFNATISSFAGGIHYGMYADALGAGNFAGYFLGNVGIGTTAANTYTLPPSRGLNGQIMRTDGLGNVTWANNSAFAWDLGGNAGTNGGNITTAGTNFLGTTDNQNIDIRTNNTFRARFSNLGEFFVGTLNTALPGDLSNAVGNAVFPWALNGYSDFNGAGTYGRILSGTTIYAGVQGETSSTNGQAAGVRGIDLVGTSGISLALPRAGVSGDVANAGGTFKFGVYGSGGLTTRTGGIMGNDFSIARGALGYYSSGAIDYSVYGFGLAYQLGAAGGRLIGNNELQKDTNIGLGIYGGVMGGWVRGLKYGFHTKGETYSLYVDGNGYTNKPLTYLIDTKEASKVPSFMSTSLKPEVTLNGKTNLENGKVFVPFDRNFRQIISNVDDIIITATPQGKSNGVYIETISKDGFWIYENNDGYSNVKIAWIAITKIKGEENPSVPNDLLATDFDKKMDGVMFNENDTTNEAQSLWWDGTKIRWDKPESKRRPQEKNPLARPSN